MGRFNNFTQTRHSVYIICKLKRARNSSEIIFPDKPKSIFSLTLNKQYTGIHTPQCDSRMFLGHSIYRISYIIEL